MQSERLDEPEWLIGRTDWMVRQRVSADAADGTERTRASAKRGEENAG
ncbi:MAG: hypothetical protein IJ468_08135 [Lachnospiraceae bacterium]|nr:hypothetical protein [Lachnospiraceae bacterium]